MNLTNIDLKNPLVFYLLLFITIFLELFAFYILKRRNYWIGIPSFALVGIMHSFLFVAKGIAHSHAIYHVVTIVLVTMLGIHDNEHLSDFKYLGIFFAVLAVFFLEFGDLKHFFSESKHSH